MSSLARPALTRGTFRDRHGRGERDAVDADGAADESTGSGRRSRVVPTPRRWRQVGDDAFSITPMMVARKPGRQGDRV